VVMTPLVSEGSVYAGAFRAGGAVIRPAKSNGTFQVEEISFSSKLPIGLGGVVKVGDFFYGTGGQSVMCVDFKTGKIQWEERSGGLALLVANGLLYAHADNGDVVLVEPSPEAFREKSRFTPANRPPEGSRGNALAFPALANGRLYIRELNSLWCYDVRARN
jgi:outer membrane protein assembly factor BamB